MNIFVLDYNIDKCAEYHVDKHIVKMPLEAAQMLCTTHWVNKYLGNIPRKLTREEWAVLKLAKMNKVRDFPYFPTMYNHPCTIWARTSLENYEWLFCYALALNDEYRYRYGKEHRSVKEVILNLPQISLPTSGITPFALAMPDNLKTSDPVESYRQFYHKDKATFASWKHRDKPYWWDENLANYETRVTR